MRGIQTLCFVIFTNVRDVEERGSDKELGDFLMFFIVGLSVSGICFM